MEKALSRFVQIVGNGETYKIVFKAGVFLIGLSLLVIGNYMADLLAYEKEAYKSKYEIEQKYVTDDIEKIKCNEKLEFIAECKFAKYQLKTSSSIQEALTTFSEIFKVLGGLFIFWGACAFLIHLFANEEMSKPEELRVARLKWGSSRKSACTCRCSSDVK